MVINSNYELAFKATVGMVAKLVAQYIESGELKDRFSAFDKTAVEYGKGFEIDVVLAASKYSPTGENARRSMAPITPPPFPWSSTR